jgi:acyl-CoA synthetase
VTAFLTLHDPATAAAYYRDGLWREETLYGLLATNGAAHPNRFALRDSARRLTWGQLLRWTDAIAGALDGAGLAPGARVAIWASNRIENVAVALACARQGLVCNPSLHRNQSAAEIAARLRQLGAAALVTEVDFDADRSVESLAQVWRLPPGREPGPDLPAIGAAPPPLARPDPNPDRVSYLAFTSGTTGQPKAVMHSANTLLANARDMVADWGHGPETVLLSLSPLSHHIAWVGLAQALLLGAEFVLDDPPDGARPLDWIIETGATYVMGVPTHAIDLLAEQRRRGGQALGAVMVFYMAGAPIPPATAAAFLDQGITPQNIYGMTENSSHQYTHPDDDVDVITSTCGRGGPAYEVRIFRQDDPDIPAEAGAVGEIGGRGAALMLGYFADQAATEAGFNRGGWFMSGDLGRLDAAGNLHIVGRAKDLIIRGGRNIHPARIENLALTHPGVDKAAAFAVPDHRLGEKVCLAIVAAGDAAPGADGVLDHLHRSGLSKYDMPEYFIALPEFPLTASGKIQKRDLAEAVKGGTISPQAVRFESLATSPGSS